MDIRLHTVVTDEKLGVTVVEAFAWDEDIYATGTAKCTAPDKYDPELGFQLASARALKDLSRVLERSARITVNERDKRRIEQQEASQRHLQARIERGKRFKADAIAQQQIAAAIHDLTDNVVTGDN